MTTGRAIHRADDGHETDITEGVQALYDLVLSSMDWGSGFWTEEDARPVAVIGRLLGFEKIDEVERYVADKAHDAETQVWRNAHAEALPFRPEALFSGVAMGGLLGREDNPVPEHEHVLSSAGRCMWPRCGYRE